MSLAEQELYDGDKPSFTADSVFDDSDDDGSRPNSGSEDFEDDDTGVPPVTDAPRKINLKRVATDPAELFAIRKRLFTDDLERPTRNTLYMEGERIDLEDPNTCIIQRKFFARIYNAMLNFSQCTFDEKNTTHQNLTWEVELTKNRLKKLKDNGYKDFYLSIPSAVAYILRALEGITHIRNNELIFQLVPVTCTIDNCVKERLRVNNLEVRHINNSVSLSVNLSVDIKFLYAGQFRVKTIPDQGDKHYLAPTACMGNYLNMAINDLYELIYDRTVEYIKVFLKRYPEDSAASAPTKDVFGDMDSRNMYSTSKASKTKDLNERQTLAFLLRSVGREINLRKVDLERNNVFVLTSALKTKPKYLNAKSNMTYSIDSTPIVDAEAVFLSSFVRARIMEDGSLNFQVYTRSCMYLSDNSEFPE